MAKADVARAEQISEAAVEAATTREQIRLIAAAVGRLEVQLAAVVKDLRDSGLLPSSRVLDSYRAKE